AIVLERVLGGGEMNGNLDPGEDVLVQAQLPHVKRMPDVLRAQDKLYGTVHRNAQRGRDDVVFGIGVVLPIEAIEVAGSVVDFLDVGRTEFPVGSRIAKVIGELLPLDLDL